MPTDEERFATMRGKYPKNDPVHLSMAVGTYDTQERGSRFTLNNVHPNLDLGGGLGTGDIFGDQPAPAPAPEPEVVEPVEPVTDSTEGDDDDPSDPPPAGDAPAVQAEAGVAEGAGAAAPLDGPEPDAAEGAAGDAGAAPAATLNVDQLPEGWESLPTAELRELAARFGVEVAPTSPKVGIINRIRAAIAG